MDLVTTQYLSHPPWGEEARTKRTIGVPPSFRRNSIIVLSYSFLNNLYKEKLLSEFAKA